MDAATHRTLELILDSLDERNENRAHWAREEARRILLNKCTIRPDDEARELIELMATSLKVLADALAETMPGTATNLRKTVAEAEAFLSRQ